MIRGRPSLLTVQLQTSACVLLEVEYAANGDNCVGFVPNKVDGVWKPSGGSESVEAETFAEELRRTRDKFESSFDAADEVMAESR
jgi:hypothetical protein